MRVDYVKKLKGLVCGVGINGANYVLCKYETVNGKRKLVWRCPYYKRWHCMLERCYSEKYQEKYPTYKGCTVCDEWLTFSNFKKWMELQAWEGRTLDKDFLIEGNKIYSPTTCVFLPQKLNKFINTRAKVRGQYPLGVRYSEKHKCMINERSKPYMSQISSQTDKFLYLGCLLYTSDAADE